MGCPCRAAWLALRWSDGSRAPHGTDLVSQHVDQPRIRITCRCTTKLQVPESFWNAPVSTRVTGVVAVDDNGHDEAATHYRARSLNRLAPLSEDVRSEERRVGKECRCRWAQDAQTTEAMMGETGRE